MVRSVAVLLLAALAARADDWPQWMGPARDGRWKETGIIDTFPADFKPLWSVKIAGGYAGPAVVGGKVYVTDYVRKDGDAANNPNARAKSEGTERILCLDARTGTELWKHEYPVKYAVSFPAGPRCTPTVADGKLYALGTMGDLRVLDANSGSLLWSKDFKADYGAPVPQWGFAGHPLVYKDLLVCLVGGPNALLVAFDRNSGKEVWKSLNPPAVDGAGYCPPTLVEAGGKTQLVIWHPEKLVGLNPADGKKYWDIALKPAYGMSIMAPRQDGDYLFAGGIGFVCLTVKLAKDKPAVEEVWRGSQMKKNGLYPVNATPIVEDGIIYGVDQPGSLRAVKIATGERLWGTQQPVTGKQDADERPVNSGTAFLVKNGDRYFLFGETGHLVIAKLSPAGYEEVSRAKILEPTNECFGRSVVWSHPAFANKCVYARNDKEIVCYSLAK